MKRARFLALSAATITGGLLLTAATIHHTPADKPMEPVTADLVEWQQGCYQTNCSSWVDGTVTGTTVHVAEDDPAWDCRTMGNKRCGPTVDVSVPLACDLARCSSDPSEIPTVVTR